MTIEIDDDLMTLEIDGDIIARAVKRPDGWWEVSCWPKFLDRNQAITSLTVAELLASGYSSDNPAVMALREELR